MQEFTVTEIAEEFAVLAIGTAHLVASSNHSLILFAASSSDGKWLRHGRLRPLREESSLVAAISEARFWIMQIAANAVQNNQFRFEGALVRIAG